MDFNISNALLICGISLSACVYIFGSTVALLSATFIQADSSLFNASDAIDHHSNFTGVSYSLLNTHHFSYLLLFRLFSMFNNSSSMLHTLISHSTALLAISAFFDQ